MLVGTTRALFVHGEGYEFPVGVGHGHGVGDDVEPEQSVQPVHHHQGEAFLGDAHGAFRRRRSRYFHPE